LSSASKAGGWIVQEINETDSSGKPVIDYWEAWQVDKGSKTTIYNGKLPYDDTFNGGPKGDKVAAQARFYEGLTLPKSFVPNNKATWAGILPSTASNPHLPTTGATEPVIRNWTVP
jgi:hypothetical protein